MTTIKHYSAFLDTGLHQPKKEGDVGHDIPTRVLRKNMTFAEKFVGLCIGEDNIHIVWPFMTRTVPSGVYIELPENVWAKIEARSSTSKKRLTLLGGIIDSGYRGEYFTVFANLSFIPRIVKDGERYASVIFHNAVRPTLVNVHDLDHFSPTSRGNTGFGSTGR